MNLVVTFTKVFCIFTGNKVHDYGREEIYAGGYPGAGAWRGICVRQQSERNARRRGGPAVQGRRRDGQCNPATDFRRHPVQIIPEAPKYYQRLRRAMEGGRRLLQREPRFLTKPKGTAGVEMPGE